MTAAAEVNPASTGYERKLTRNPSRSAPMASWMTPITAVSSTASAIYDAVPAMAIVLSPSTSISESTVTGPTEVWRPVPVSA